MSGPDVWIWLVDPPSPRFAGATEGAPSEALAEEGGSIAVFVDEDGEEWRLCSDRRRMAEALRPLAEQFAREEGCAVRLVRFAAAETVETVYPGVQ